MSITTKQARRISRFLSLVLRHRPQEIGIQLDPQGWVEVESLISAVNTRMPLDLETLEQIVRENDKQRFAFSADRRKIRASQGHSVQVELGHAPQAPPDILYHGTTQAALESIRQQGLLKGRRQYVHLSCDPETARQVGQRHGPPVILKIRAEAMHAAGHAFYLSANGVWLVALVPPEFVEFPCAKA